MFFDFLYFFRRGRCRSTRRPWPRKGTPCGLLFKRHRYSRLKRAQLPPSVENRVARWISQSHLRIVFPCHTWYVPSTLSMIHKWTRFKARRHKAGSTNNAIMSETGENWLVTPYTIGTNVGHLIQYRERFGGGRFWHFTYASLNRVQLYTPTICVSNVCRRNRPD